MFYKYNALITALLYIDERLILSWLAWLHLPCPPRPLPPLLGILLQHDKRWTYPMKEMISYRERGAASASASPGQ